MLAEQNMMVYEDLTPVGVFDDGQKEEVTVSNGDIWTERGYTPSTF
jgi:hypothetical protein